MFLKVLARPSVGATATALPDTILPSFKNPLLFEVSLACLCILYKMRVKASSTGPLPLGKLPFNCTSTRRQQSSEVSAYFQRIDLAVDIMCSGNPNFVGALGPSRPCESHPSVPCCATCFGQRCLAQGTRIS